MPRHVTKTKHQAETKIITVEELMRSEAFRRGVADVRAGRAPRFDEETKDSGAWNYEWGRQFAVLAPRDMEIILRHKKQLNPDARKLWWRFFNSLLGDGGICP